MSEKEVKNLGPPDIAVGGFQVWVHGRESPESDDYWDGNWLRVTAHCGASGAEVWVSGALIRLNEIESWMSQCQQMHDRMNGSAALNCLEPELRVEMEMGNAGRMLMTVHITPDNLSQRHEFKFELDQTYLPNLISGGQEVLREYPIKGTPS